MLQQQIPCNIFVVFVEFSHTFFYKLRYEYVVHEGISTILILS
jgi:hypothetical protein